MDGEAPPDLPSVADAVRTGVLPGRVWLYANYHCNLTCSYCLTESGPTVPRRELRPERMIAIAAEAAALGFTDLGVTGGEPFLLAHLPDTLVGMSEILPVIALTNGTVLGDHRRERLRRLADRPIALQISLDSADPDVNDLARGPDNFRKVVDVIPRLVEMGIRVRIASTSPGTGTGDVEDSHGSDRAGADSVLDARAADAAERLCELHRALGIPDIDHVARPVVARGRGLDVAGAAAADMGNLLPELTITVDGAFWSPFGPTVRNGRLDTDLLVTTTVHPLATPATELLRLVSGRLPGDDATTSIR
jgi:Radical SAM superfamily